MWCLKRYVLLTGYTCLAVTVAATAIVMYVNSDPDSSIVLIAGFGVFALALATLTVRVYRSFLTGGRASRPSA